MMITGPIAPGLPLFQAWAGEPDIKPVYVEKVTPVFFTYYEPFIPWDGTGPSAEVEIHKARHNNKDFFNTFEEAKHAMMTEALNRIREYRERIEYHANAYLELSQLKELELFQIILKGGSDG
jgi:hypothetical protein